MKHENTNPNGPGELLTPVQTRNRAVARLTALRQEIDEIESKAKQIENKADEMRSWATERKKAYNEYLLSVRQSDDYDEDTKLSFRNLFPPAKIDAVASVQVRKLASRYEASDEAKTQFRVDEA